MLGASKYILRLTPTRRSGSVGDVIAIARVGAVRIRCEEPEDELGRKQ